MWREARKYGVHLLAPLVMVACSSASPRTSAQPVGVTVAGQSAAPSATPSPGPAVAAGITVHAGQPGLSFDRRLLGTNVPAWVGPSKLADPKFRTSVVDSGATVVRMPGGSWSDGYRWLGCENGDAAVCANPWAAKPTDFLNFLRDTKIAGMWTVSFNTTAQEAAALVAFFNGAVGSSTVIGVDRNGQDWGTVGKWADLRAAHGNAEPLAIKYWELGNEIYGGKASAGPGCQSWGWEETWTCDGTKYVTGDANHDGYLQFQSAMKAVDPSILLGAVGVAKQSDFNGWGDKVLAAAGDRVDFYVVHNYGYGDEPSLGKILSNTQSNWGGLMNNVSGALKAKVPGRQVPVAITEFNLVANQDNDKSQLMTKSVNTLFMADSIGQMANAGVSFANQYNAINGKASNGTDYGMIDSDTGARNPQFYALEMWSKFGTHLVPVTTKFNSSSQMSTFASIDDSGAAVVMVINKTSSPIATSVAVDGFSSFTGTIDQFTTTDLDSRTVSYNGSGNAEDALSLHAPTDLGHLTGPLSYTFPAYSVSLIKLQPSAS